MRGTGITSQWSAGRISAAPIKKGLGTLMIVVPLLASCGPTPPSGSDVQRSERYLATHRDLGGGPTAIVGGTLIDVDGCLAYDTIDGIALPVWPTQASAWEVDGTTVVTDGGGRPVATLGQESYVGGGYDYSLDQIQQWTNDAIPLTCQLGRYMLVTDLRNYPGP